MKTNQSGDQMSGWQSCGFSGVIFHWFCSKTGEEKAAEHLQVCMNDGESAFWRQKTAESETSAGTTPAEQLCETIRSSWEDVWTNTPWTQQWHGLISWHTIQWITHKILTHTCRGQVTGLTEGCPSVHMMVNRVWIGDQQIFLSVFIEHDELFLISEQTKSLNAV